MLTPRRAPVKPRVISPESGETLALEDEVLRAAQERPGAVFVLAGPAGSGKTTALEHLAAVLPGDARVQLEDENGTPGPEAGTARVFVRARCAAKPGRSAYRLAPWGADDLIEYLLAAHRPRCASVMKRIQPDDHFLLRGLPELWRVVLDRLAEDEAIPDARTALHRHLAAQLPDTDIVERVRSACLNALAAGAEAWEQLAKPGFPKEVLRIVRHNAVRLFLATERVVADLRGEGDCDYLALRLPRELVEAVGPAIAGKERPLDHLRRMLDGPSWSHAMAASLLHAADRRWVPKPGSVPVLAGAYLEGVQWCRIELPRANLAGADLGHADLLGANLDGANAAKARLREARLSGASVKYLGAAEADLSCADLSLANAERSRFDAANLEGAIFDNASLASAAFQGANLAGATFRGADLKGAVLLGADVKGTDFAGADLRGTVLSGLRLREATLFGAWFEGAGLSECDLEGVELSGADFQRADLQGALLTGAAMPGADFTNARLAGARLAEVNWEGACLRWADLSGATFHMGSSRNGLVFSPFACEGSRTGFYTDDYDDRHYKSPEELRKANLCGADLRGARIENVDFYLVDLRGARYDAEQEPHLRRCGAVLETRPA